VEDFTCYFLENGESANCRERGGETRGWGAPFHNQIVTGSISQAARGGGGQPCFFYKL